MRYWVYGVDDSSKLPRDPLFLEADSEGAARAQATAEGMQVEEIEAVRPRSSTAGKAASPPGEDSALVRFLGREYVLARCLVVVLRVLAFLAAIWGIANTGIAVEAASAVEATAKGIEDRTKAMHLERTTPEAVSAARSAATWAVVTALMYGVALVSILLAMAEGIRLALVIEERTQGEPATVGREKTRHRPK